MKVILREEVGTLGNAGDLITVKDGYARNYLLPRNLAVRADQRNVKQLEHTQRAMLARRTKLEASAKAAAKVIEEVGRVVVTRSCGPEGKLFGSVTTRDIVAAFAEREISIEKRWLILQEPYKALGDFDLDIRVGQGIISTVKVSVEPDEASAAAITAFAAAAAEAAAAAPVVEPDETSSDDSVVGDEA
jgi:large subunit ribosomal protein L9